VSVRWAPTMFATLYVPRKKTSRVLAMLSINLVFLWIQAAEIRGLLEGDTMRTLRKGLGVLDRNERLHLQN